MTVSRPSAARCAAVSAPLPVWSSQQTAFGPIARKADPSRGERLMRLPAVALAAKKMRWRAMKSRCCSSRAGNCLAMGRI